MKNTAYHQAHLMAEHVSDDIQQLKSEVFAQVDSIVTPNQVSSESPVPSITQPVPAMYASTHVCKGVFCSAVYLYVNSGNVYIPVTILL